MDPCLIPASGLATWRSSAPQCLQVLSGTAWVTQTGDHRDHVIRSGGQLTVRPGVCVALQALDHRPVIFQVGPAVERACA